MQQDEGALSPAKEAIYEQAQLMALEDPGLTMTLGIIVLSAVASIDRQRGLTGDGLEHVYRTHFEVDGRNWGFELKELPA